MPTIHWQHIIEAAVGYSGHSHRIARMRNEGAMFAPPYRSGTWMPPLWHFQPARPDQPSEVGDAPASYGPPFPHKFLEDFEDRTYAFAFWSYAARTPNSQPNGTEFLGNSTLGGDFEIDAKAWYMWNQGGGPGPNAMFVDAFCLELNDYIPDWFVDVYPDPGPQTYSPESDGLVGPLTRALNEDGYLATDTQVPKGGIEVKARGVIGDPPMLRAYTFAGWIFITLPGFPMQQANDAVIDVPQSSIIFARALYIRNPPVPPPTPPPPPVVVPFGFQNVISGQAGGTVIILGNVFPTGDRPPGGPPGPETYLPVENLRVAIVSLENKIRDLQQTLGNELLRKQVSEQQASGRRVLGKQALRKK